MRLDSEDEVFKKKASKLIDRVRNSKTKDRKKARIPGEKNHINTK